MAQTLEQYENMRQQWISDISHELRTPLSILRGELEALKYGIREVNGEAIDSLDAETRHLAEIVNDLHELSLADAGVLTIKKAPVDPLAVLEEALGRFKKRFDKNRMTIENGPGTHPPTIISSDAGRLLQLFSNLLENALRYADSPGVLRVGEMRSRGRVTLFIEDSGPGVPEEALSRLFERLYRVDLSRARSQGGSGLGLSICKSITNALGGEIRATNGDLGGLRVEIELPKTE